MIRKKEKITFIATAVGAIVDFALNLFLIKQMGYFGASVTTLIAEAVVFGICCIAMKKYKMNLIYSKSFPKTYLRILLLEY